MRWIGLVDCNNFFVSCERLFRPDLRTRPVVVLSSNDGCVVARSQEVKDMGIPMGVPYFQVKDTLQKAKTAVFSSQFTLYRDISRRVFTVVQQEVSCMQQYSIDEAFFTYTGDESEAFARQLKTRVEQVVGIPVSIGVAASKTQAKYASTLAKRQGGVRVVDNSEFTALAKDIPLGEIWGVGVGRVRAFQAHDLHMVADLLQADTARVAKVFGVEGERLQYELLGRAVLLVTPERALQKSIMSSRSFKTSTTDKSVVADALAYHVRHAVADLRAQGQVADTLRIQIRPSRHGDFAFQGGGADAVLLSATDDTFVFLDQAKRLLEQIWRPGVPYQKAGILLSGLRLKEQVVPSLFGAEQNDKRKRLLQSIDALNSRYGDDMVRLGSVLHEPAWQAKRDKLSPAYTTRWSDVPVVRT